MSPEAIAGFAAAAVGLLAVGVTIYLRWSAHRIRVEVEVREAWKPPRWFVATLDTIDQIPTEPTVFEATVVAINRGERPVYVEVLGLYAVEGDTGFDDRLERDVREVPPGGHASLVVDEETTDFDLRAPFRGFAELTTGEVILSELFTPDESPAPPDR